MPVQLMSENMANQYTVLSRVFPFATYIIFLALGEYLTPLFRLVGINSSWLYSIKILAVILLLFYFWKNYRELLILPALKDFQWASVSGLLVFIIWIMPYPAWMAIGLDAKAINPVLNLGHSEAFLWLLMRILGAVLVVPLIEELFWRSFIMRWIDSKNFLSIAPENISSFAYVGTACLFALEHHLWFAGLFAGLVYGELYKTYKNLWIPIFAHAITNSLLGSWVILTGSWQYW